MRSVLRLGFVALALIVRLDSSTSAQETWAINQSAIVEFMHETRVGPTLLSPGVYHFQHQVIDGHSYLAAQVSNRSYVPGHHYYGAVVNEIARVPCRRIPTREEQSDTAVYVKNDSNGVATVVRLSFRGEAAIHVVMSEPHDEPRKEESSLPTGGSS